MQYVPLWTTILRSRKVFDLDDPSFRFWVNCLALAQDHDQRNGALPDLDSIAFSLRLNDDETEALMARLVNAGLVDDDGKTYVVHNWKKWKYKPDPKATERKRNQRAREKSDVTGVTRDISAAVTDKSTPGPSSESSCQSKPNASRNEPLGSQNSVPTTIDVTDVTGVTRDIECHAIQISTGQNRQNTPQPPKGAERSDVEPFQSEPPRHESKLSPAAERVMDQCGRRWGSQGADISADLLSTFDPAIVAYAADQAFDKFGRRLTPGGTAYLRKICQNNRDGLPAQGSPRAPAQPAAPIVYTVCHDPDDLIPPVLRGKKHA